MIKIIIQDEKRRRIINQARCELDCIEYSKDKDICLIIDKLPKEARYVRILDAGEQLSPKIEYTHKTKRLVIDDNDNKPIIERSYISYGIPCVQIDDESRQERLERLLKERNKVNPLKNLVLMIKRKFK